MGINIFLIYSTLEHFVCQMKYTEIHTVFIRKKQIFTQQSEIPPHKYLFFCTSVFCSISGTAAQPSVKCNQIQTADTNQRIDNS